MLPLQGCEAGGEDVSRDGLGAGHAQDPFELPVAATGGSLHSEDFDFDPFSLIQHVLTCQGQGVSLRGPMQQPDAQTGLKRRQSPADG